MRSSDVIVVVGIEFKQQPDNTNMEVRQSSRSLSSILAPTCPHPMSSAVAIMSKVTDVAITSLSVVADCDGTWFHPVWYTNYQKYSHLVQNLCYCRSCIYSYIQKVLCRHDF